VSSSDAAAIWSYSTRKLTDAGLNSGSLATLADLTPVADNVSVIRGQTTAINWSDVTSIKAKTDTIVWDQVTCDQELNRHDQLEPGKRDQDDDGHDQLE